MNLVLRREGKYKRLKFRLHKGVFLTLSVLEEIGVIINEIDLVEVYAPLGNFTLLVLNGTLTYRRSW